MVDDDDVVEDGNEDGEENDLDMDARAQALYVETLPHVRRWIKRFQKLIDAMPPEVWVFVADSSPVVMAFDPDGHPFETEGNAQHSGGTDRAATIKSMRAKPKQWDGGGF